MAGVISPSAGISSPMLSKSRARLLELRAAVQGSADRASASTSNLKFGLGAEGLAEVEITAEAMALAKRIGNDTVHFDAQLSSGSRSTLGWVFNESFEVQPSTKRIEHAPFRGGCPPRR